MNTPYNEALSNTLIDRTIREKIVRIKPEWLQWPTLPAPSLFVNLAFYDVSPKAIGPGIDEVSLIINLSRLHHHRHFIVI